MSDIIEEMGGYLGDGSEYGDDPYLQPNQPEAGGDEHRRQLTIMAGLKTLPESVFLDSEQLLAYIDAECKRAEKNTELQTRLHVLSRLKAEADRTFGNPEQLIYTEHDRAWQELKEYQLSPTAESEEES